MAGQGRGPDGTCIITHLTDPAGLIAKADRRTGSDHTLFEGELHGWSPLGLELFSALLCLRVIDHCVRTAEYSEVKC